MNPINPSNHHNDKKIEIYLCLFLFGGLALSFSGHGTFVDENLIIQTVESLVTKGNLTVTWMFQALPGPDGQYYSRYGITFPLLLTPFFLLGYALNWLFPHTYAFYGNPHFFAMLWGNLLITVLTGWLFYRLCRFLGGSVKTAALLSVALLFATPFWPYTQTLFRLTAATAFLLAALLLILQHFQKPSFWKLFSLFWVIAWGLNLREDLVVGFMAMGVFVLLRGEGKTRWDTAAAMISGAVLGCLIWGFHNWIRFSAIFIENYKDLTFNYPLVVSIPQLLVGLRRGLIIYAPLCLLLPLSFSASRRNKRLDIWILCTFILLVYLFLYAKSDMWHGGRCWGPRHMYFLAPFAMLPGVFWIDDIVSNRKKWFFIVAFAAGTILNWPGVYAHQGKYMDFFTSPSIFSLLMKSVVHPEYITFDELDLWWIRMMKMNPLSLWPVAFACAIAFTLWSGMRLWKSIRSTENGRDVNP